MNEQALEERKEQPLSLLDTVSRAAQNPDIDVDKMERLMQMAERLQDKENEKAFNEAMSRAQARLTRVSADASNPQTRSRYASYAKLDSVLRPVYTDEGFALSFDTGDAPNEDDIRVICHVSHKFGFTRNYHVDMDASGKGAKGGDVMTKTHARGSGMSYGMRYLLKMIFNVAVGEDDDDGNRASAPAITSDQLRDLECLIEEVGADKAAYGKYCAQMFGANTLADIRASDYPKAISALEAKRKKGEK